MNIRDTYKSRAIIGSSTIWTIWHVCGCVFVRRFITRDNIAYCLFNKRQRRVSLSANEEATSDF